MTSTPIDWHDDPRHQANIERKAQRKRDLVRPDVFGDVLHIGCGGGAVGRPGEGGWFHADLDAMTDGRLVGIDVDEPAVEAARERGYDARVADAEDFDLGGQFDTVVAANVIEHLASPGAMLDCAREHLRPDGRLIVTTPRGHVPWWTMQALKNGSPEPHPEHVMWFCEDTLRALLRRQGFRVTHYEAWGFDRQGMSAADRAWRTLERALTHVPQFADIDKVQHFAVAEPAEGRS